MPPRHLFGDLIRCPATQLGMGTHRIVVFLPVSQNLSRMAEGGEQRLVEAFVPQPAVEAFDKPVLLRFPRGDIMSFDLHLIGPFQDGMGGELRTVVADNHKRFAIAFHQNCQFPATRPPDKDVSATRARFLRLKSSITVRMRNRRPQIRASETKSRLQRCPGF